MLQTKPFFIIKKYRLILKAAIIVETVNYIVSLTDSIVAGSAVGSQAFAAIGLIAPFLCVSVFLATIVSTGTAVNYSYHVGSFDNRRANEFFSQGVYSALIVGAVYALIMLLLGGTVIRNLSASESIAHYLNDYYYIILFIFLMNPITYTLDIMLISNGSEKLSIAANISQIVSNISLSLFLVQFYGVRGVAIATVVSKLIYILIACLHFFKKSNTLRLLPIWKLKDFFILVKSGFVKSLTYGMEAILFWLSNQYVLSAFGSDTLVVLVAVEKLLELLTLFMGVAMSCQPLIGTLLGEKNTKGMLALMHTVLMDMIITGAIISVIVLIGAPVIANVFGITSGSQHIHTVMSLRIISTTLVFHAVMTLFFAYYVLINKQLSAFIICLVNNLLSPVIMTVFLSSMTHSTIGLWIGFGTAPVCAALICALIILFKHGKARFPFLIPEDKDRKILIYSFPITDQNAADMAATVERDLKQASVSPQTSVLAGVITEDMLMVIAERNSDSKKPLYAECSIFCETDGVRMIVRDSGVIFDITDTDGRVDSFRQYIVSSLMLNQDRKQYITTTGYNRNELFFKC